MLWLWGAYLNMDAVENGYLVTGVFTYENSGDKYYTLFPINAPSELYMADGSVSEYLYNRCCIKAENLEGILGGKELTAGDIFKFEDYGIYGIGFEGRIELSTPWLSYDEDGNEIENTTPPKYIGNALAMFGEEFKPVLENEMYIAPNAIIEDKNAYDVTSDNQIVKIGEFKDIDARPSDKIGYIVTGDNQIIKLGDVTIDEYVSIIDVLAVNQALLGIHSLSEYAKIAADVNHNGTVDDADAMMILKSLVGLETLE